MIDPSNILIGSLISMAVSQLKRIPFVKKNPKVVTAVLSTVIPAGLATYGVIKGVETQPWQDLAGAMATQFAAAVATHETVTHYVVDSQFQSEKL